MRIAGCVNGLHPGGATLPVGRKKHLYFLYILLYLVCLFFLCVCMWTFIEGNFYLFIIIFFFMFS